MIAVAVILVVLIVVASIVIPLLLRSYGVEEARTEARLHDSHTRTLAVAIPNGMDPAVLRLALGEAGFASALDRVGDDECLLVECKESDRARLRSIIEAVHVTGYDGSELTLGPVRFEDER